MKSVALAAVASLIALSLGACAGMQDAQSDQTTAQLMAVSDSTIVPGLRAGRVFLGMSEEQLYARLGSPFRSEVTDNGKNVLYYYPDLTVGVKSKTHQVGMIYVVGHSYSTEGGVTVGVPELAVKSMLGQPVAEFGDNRQRVFCYDGVEALVKNGSINGLWVFPGACGKSVKS